MTEERHFIIHKPFGFLSQFINNQKRRRNKKMLGELEEFPKGTMSIGRLDQNSEGLLLLTTDGKESERVRSKKVEKEYFVQVDGIIDDEAITKLQSGVVIKVNKENYTTLPCAASKIEGSPTFSGSDRKVRSDNHGPTSWASITIREGKFRQVRKMTAAVGFPTLRLVRVRIGKIQLGQMNPGECLEVEQFLL